MYDTILNDYPRLNGETNDSPRIQRAIDATTNGILCIPKGDYEIAEPLFIKNRCSLHMHPAARLIATEKMEFVLSYDGSDNYHALALFNEDGSVYDNLGLFIDGGDIEANGLASCLYITNAHHFTLRNTVCHNGVKYGLCVGNNNGHIYELICYNVYCKCYMQGLAGNIGIYSTHHDAHYIDCLVVDYTVGIKMTGSSNKLTRCHIWGGAMGPAGMDLKEWSDAYARRKMKIWGTPEGLNYSCLGDFSCLGDDVATEVPAMLLNSVAFDIQDEYNILDGCCADTAEIGFRINGNTKLIGCEFFNNPLMGLKKSTAIHHDGGELSVIGCGFRGPVGTEKLYEGIGEKVQWIGNTLEGKGLEKPAFE